MSDLTHEVLDELERRTTDAISMMGRALIIGSLQFVEAIEPHINELITAARERDRLLREKEDLRQRNQLLRKRLDAHPDKIKPRLDIMKRLDEAEAALKLAKDAQCDSPAAPPKP